MFRQDHYLGHPCFSLFKKLLPACTDPQVPELRLTNDGLSMRPTNPIKQQCNNNDTRGESNEDLLVVISLPIYEFLSGNMLD